jgi:DNA-binding PucR family transcriptional regulator
VTAEVPAAPGADDRDVWEHVLSPLADEIAERATELSAALAERTRLTLPELYGDPETVEANRASAEASLHSIAAGLRQGGDPEQIELPAETVAFARDSARRGLPVGQLLRGYRIAQAAFLDWAVGELAQRSRDRDELARATEIFNAWSFAYIDAALLLADQTYAAERERFARSSAAVRAETITAILEQREGDPRAAGLRLRYVLEREHLGVCAWLEQAPADSDSVELLEAAIAEVGHALGVEAVLMHPLGLLLAAGWISAASPLDPAALDHVVLDSDALPGVRISVGEPADGVAGFRSTHHQALHARRVAVLSHRAVGSVTRYGLVSLQALASADIDQAQEFVDRELGALADDDDTCRRLAATLRVYLDEHASRGRAAKRLGIHENTISYRIKQAEEILGRSVEQDTLNLRVALALASLTRQRRSTR